MKRINKNQIQIPLKNDINTIRYLLNLKTQYIPISAFSKLILIRDIIANVLLLLVGLHQTSQFFFIYII